MEWLKDQPIIWNRAKTEYRTGKLVRDRLWEEKAKELVNQEGYTCNGELSNYFSENEQW